MVAKVEQVWYGNTGNGVLSNARPYQMRQVGTTTPIFPGGASATPSFDVWMMARSINGRAQVLLDIEVKEMGIAFDGSNLYTTSLVDTDLNGSEIQETLTNISPSTGYHWRMRINYNQQYPAKLQSVDVRFLLFPHRKSCLWTDQHSGQ